MNLHEYQAKELFSDYGIPVPLGMVATGTDEAIKHAKSINSKSWVVKAQIHAGGRGKAGGVKIVHDEHTLHQVVKNLLNSKLYTKQTGNNGQIVNCVLIQEDVNINKEFYLSLITDRKNECISIIASIDGGMDIEEVANNAPEKILTVNLNTDLEIHDEKIKNLANKLNFNENEAIQFINIVASMHKLFIDKDLSLIEINPLVLDANGKLLALDAKVSVDDNALLRQPELARCLDSTQIDEKEIIAKQFDLNYVTLDGDIACMVNGAGLAMATMDIIKLHGGNPANFLDVGGGTNADKVKEAFKIISSTPNLKAILINIFGGIVHCDIIATGIINAVEEIGLDIPIVVRLAGTNSEQAKNILSKSKLDIITAKDLTEAAQKVVTVRNEK